MKPTIDTQDIRWQTDNMNEWVMEEAAATARPALEPEVLAVLVWDDPPDPLEQKATVASDETISESLVNAGNEEAVLEQRVTADTTQAASAEE